MVCTYHRSAMDKVIADEVDRVLLTLRKLCQIDTLAHKSIGLRKCLCAMSSGECFNKCQKATRVHHAATLQGRPNTANYDTHLWVSLFSSFGQGHSHLTDVPREELFEVMHGTHVHCDMDHLRRWTGAEVTRYNILRVFTSPSRLICWQQIMPSLVQWVCGSRNPS